MELKITNNTQLNQVQNEFNKMYPYLKIEFTANRKEGDTNAKSSRLAPATTFKQVLNRLNVNNEFFIDVNGNRTVADVERDFKECTGLTVQLYRKSGNVWIETSLTDDWTLERQNQSGEILSYSA